MLNRKLILLLFFFTKLAEITAENYGSWALVQNQTRFSTKISLHTEFQFRSYDVRPNTEQVLLRIGLNYHVNSSFVFSAGYGRITNYVDDDVVFKSFASIENRAWEQLLLKSAVGRFQLEHRYRFEQRWITMNSEENYKNRIRYLLRATVPINTVELSKNTFFMHFYNEVFIHFNNTPFDRNRLYGGLGFQFNKNANVQLGNLFQTVGTKSKNFLLIGLYYNFDLRKLS